MSLPAFGVKRPTVANLTMIALLAAGAIFGLSLQREFFPEVRPNRVVVSAPYPGAAPDEVERSLAIKIEDALTDLDDVDEIESTATDGAATINIKFLDGVDADEAVAEVKRKVDALQDLPEESERIVVEKIEPNLPVIILSLYGDEDPRVLKAAIRQIEEDLRSLEGMGEVLTSGIVPDEILVEARPEALLAHGVSLPFVSDRVRQAMAELPGGAIRSSTLNVPIRTIGAKEEVEEVRRIVIKGEAGQIVRLEDVADVSLTLADTDITERLNGKPSVSLTIVKVGDEDAVSIADMVKAYVAGRKGEPISLSVRERLAKLFKNPRDDSPVSNRIAAYELGQSRTAPLPGELALTTDLARFIVGRLNLLTRNAAWGGLLVFITLVILLNFRVAFWAAIGLVISLSGALAVMSFFGISLNLLTMFGLIVVLGLLVDDAIVVAENITARHEQGEPALRAAINGTLQVLWPVVATVITTVCAFLPLGLIEGELGDFLAAVPLVVAVALGVSLIEALFILPSHMGHSLIKLDERHEKGGTILGKIEDRFDRFRDHLFLDRIVPMYTRLVKVATARRYTSVAFALACMIVSFGMVGGGRVPFIFFEASDSETIIANLRMPVGTPLERTNDVLQKIEEVALEMPEIDSVFAIAGFAGSSDGAEQSVSAHLGQMYMELKPVEQRDRTSEQIRAAIREGLGPVPGIESLRLEDIQGGPEGPPLTITVTGRSESQIARVVEDVKAILDDFEGVYDVADDAGVGQRELRVTLRDGASELGFTPENVARQVRGMVYGLEAYTFPGTREDVDVRVTMPDRVRRSLAAIERQHVFTPAGVPVPLIEVARLEETAGHATVKRLDGRRAVTVTADANTKVANPEEVMAAMRPQLEDLEQANPGVQLLERGRQKEFQDGMRTLPLGMLVAAGLIFVVLAWLFQSYSQPLVVMAAIPFATIGMIWGHWLMGFPMTFLSLIGFIALTGIVVNDSLIYVQFYNEKRNEGMPVREAVVDAGRARIRAIILTTLTTVLGLSPLMLEQSFQARFLIPMAITISFGLISATGIILLILPSMLVIADDVRRVWRALWRGRWEEGELGIPTRIHEPAPTADEVLHPE